MATVGTRPNAPAGPDSARPLVEARLAFEEGWRSGRRPAIEDFVERARPLDRSALLPDLIRVEVRHRRRSGEMPRPDEYERRFPADGDTIAGIDWASLTPPVPASDGGPRRRIARFELIERVGAGGFGEVWRAFDPHLQRDVAVKLAHFIASEDGRPDLLLHEARAAGRLSHPAIVPVHESGVEGDVAYIVSDFVRGTTLDRRLKDGPLAPREAAALAKTLTEALAYAHAQGVIHRDIKPSNVLLDEAGGPHLTDFGIARRAAADQTISEIGQALGSPAYMSPEQAAGDTAAVDGRSDVYALGLLLFEMLAGRRAYPGDARDALRGVLQGPPPPLRSVSRSTPRNLAAIVAVATAYEPWDRYPTAAAMAEDLARYLDGRRLLRVRSTRELTSRRSALAAMAAAAVSAMSFKPVTFSPRRAVISEPAGGVKPQEGIVGPRDLDRKPQSHLDAFTSPRRVSIDTRPGGARVWMFHLDPFTGQPQARYPAHGGLESPCTLEVPPGEYFVVAELPDGRFNEVTRWVPYPFESLSLPDDHLSWQADGDGVELKPGPIPPPFAGIPLVFFPEVPRYFTSGRSWRPARELRIPAFWMMSTEFSVACLADVPGERPASVLSSQTPESHAALLKYDEAVTVLERVGFRLPTEFEWECAARWSEPNWDAIRSALPAELEGFGPIGVPAADRSGPGLEVYGLRSGAPEWTSTPGDDPIATNGADAYGPRGPIVLSSSVDPRRRRVVRGGGDNVQTGTPLVEPVTRDPGLRSLIDRFGAARKIGFRGVRSAVPHRGLDGFAEAGRPSELSRVDLGSGITVASRRDGE